MSGPREETRGAPRESDAAPRRPGVPCNRAALDRRAFLGTAGAAAGLLAVAAAAPFRAGAFEARDHREPPGRDAIDSSMRAAPNGTYDEPWDIDDMWGHAPRYAHPIPHAPARTAPVAWEHVDPIDLMLVI